jgi:hypothetical protein
MSSRWSSGDICTFLEFTHSRKYYGKLKTIKFRYRNFGDEGIEKFLKEVKIEGLSADCFR